MRVAFLPWSKSEKSCLYQEQLAAGLADLDVEVDGAVTGRFLLPWVLKHRADILHLHWLNQFSAAKTEVRAVIKLASFIAELFLVKILGVRIVFTAHNLKPHESTFPKIDLLCTALVCRLAHGTVAHGPTAKALLERTSHLKDRGKIVVIPYGNYMKASPNQISREDTRKQLGLPDRSLVFLFLGAIRPYKGVIDLIESFGSLKVEGAHLLIAGWPLNEEIAEQVIAKCSVVENTHLYPRYVGYEEHQVFMNAADVVVFPYKDILTSGAAVLAMSFGKACVAPRMGCIQDVLDEDGAFLYDPAESDGLYRALQRAAAKSRCELESMGTHNLLAAQEWSWEYVASRYLDLYRRCIDGRRATERSETCGKGALAKA